MTVYATRLTNGSDTAARVRVAEQLFLPAGTSPLTSRSGIRPDGGGVVAAVAGTMGVTVSSFMAWIQGSVSTGQGGYPFVCDAQVTLTLAAGHASLARIDTIAAVVRDAAFDGSGNTDAQVVVVQGTPASSPAAPALPANAIALRDVNVPAGTSAGGGGLSASNLGADRRTYLGGWTAFTPTVTADNGSFGSVTATGRWCQTGKRVDYQVNIRIVSIGSASGFPRFALPMTAQAGNVYVGSGREIEFTGVALMAFGSSDGTYASIIRYDNASPAAASRTMVLTGSYEAA